MPRRDAASNPVGAPTPQPGTRTIADRLEVNRSMRTVVVPDDKRGSEPVPMSAGGERKPQELHPVPLPFEDKARRTDLKGNVRHRVPQRFLGERGYKFPRDMEETSNDG